MRRSEVFCVLGLALFGNFGSCFAEAPLAFSNVTAEAGLLPEIAGIRGHGAGWGDIDGDGWLDLYVGTFHTRGARPNLLFRNTNGKFALDSQDQPRLSTRATGIVLADFDNDGDADLYVASMPGPQGSKLAEREGHAISGCSLLRNDGGNFTDVSDGNGACPRDFGGRSAAVLDFDGDGLLDLLVGEDPLPGYNGSPTRSSRLFRNLGELQFEDASRAAGVPADIPGLGVAAGDLNDDGWPDLFLAANDGGNVLLLNDGRGKFQEPPGGREVFAWPTAGGDNMICGVALGDVNRDGRLDIVIGQHFERPWLDPVPIRLYLNQGGKDGRPQFRDITEAAGLKPLPMKAPHVEIQDFDNDGWPDISTSIVKFAGGRPHPVIFRSQGVRDGLPSFKEDALAVNDFPNDSDRAVERAGELFGKVIRDGRITYSAPGPSADFDNDGRLDLFLASWWAEAPSLLLRNEAAGGNWLQVLVKGSDGVNRMGVGTQVKVFAAGEGNEDSKLLGYREIAIGFGYASGQPSIAHFGLGAVHKVDLEVVLPHGRGTLRREGIAANQRLTIRP